MKTLASEILKSFTPGVISGRKIEPESRGMVIKAWKGEPASHEPDHSRTLGTVGGIKIAAPPDDPNRERPNVWTDMPSWVKSSDFNL